MLELYVTGMAPISMRAIVNIRSILNEYLPGSYELEVIDMFQNPGLAKSEQIIAVPTLIRRLPLPIRRFIGDLSETERILAGLDLKTKSEQ